MNFLLSKDCRARNPGSKVLTNCEPLPGLQDQQGWRAALIVFSGLSTYRDLRHNSRNM
jgi:hypothetical protein